MTIVWITLLMGLGVMFGLAALVTDLGYGFVQVRGMQNGADAAAMAAARLIAGSAAPGPSGGVIFLVTETEAHNKALDFADDNRPAGPAGASYPLAVRFRPCPGQSTNSADFTAASDNALVTELGGSKLSAGAAVPPWTCMVSVYARVSHNSYFATTIGHPTIAETGRATARIFGTGLPPPGRIWPLTRWICTGIDDPDTANKDEGQTANDVSGDTVNGQDDRCDDDEVANTAGNLPCVQDPPAPGGPVVPTPCTFWDSNSHPGGSFKNFLDFSRYSGLAAAEGITRPQMLGGWESSCEQPPDYLCPDLEYDTAHPGTNNKIVDVPHWLEFGSSVGLDLTEAARTGTGTDPCQGLIPPANPVVNPSDLVDPAICTNSRLETFNGDLGNNLAGAMRAYIDHFKAGNSAEQCGFSGANNPDNDYANVTVFFWRWGEQDTENNNDSIALTNRGRLWGYYGDSVNDQANDLKRVIIQRYTNFRFCRGLVAGSSVRGFFVAYVTDLAPTGQPPSPIANTVGLVE